MRYKDNKIKFRGTVCEIALESPTKGKSITLVDAEDWDKIKHIYWTIDPPRARRPSYTPYVRGWCPKIKKTIPLHRFLLDAPDDKYVDHINRDGLDNRKENLRLATHRENTRNSGTPHNNKLGLKGVRITIKGFFQARLYQRNEAGRLTCVRASEYFKTPEEAAQCYNSMALKHFGEFAGLNDVENYVRNQAAKEAIKRQQLSLSQRIRRRRNKTTGFYAVRPRPGNRFQSEVSIDCKLHYVGNFGCAEEAARAYDRKMKELFGEEYPYLNFPHDNT